ncbi:MAG: DegV family protein [Peptococcaceae bacterium]|nr:DegV family protein [Peptococcaceae bacterium]MBO5139571.1 DegV family protein [Peptococcaceae bacterium]MBP3625404.1 DegV family protein [Peptococcaceae bacterium]
MSQTDKIAILIDSGTDVPVSFQEQYHMFLAPLKIIFQDGEYEDGIDLTASQLYERLPQEIPKTSLPSTETVLHVLDQIRAEGYNKVLVITISSGLSGTNNMLRLLGESINDLELYVYDTKNIAIGSGFFAIQAAQYIEQGMDWNTLIAKLESGRSKSKVFFCLDTLEYLQKGGRIGLVTAMLGTALNLKPIISCNPEGIYYTVAKVRGRQQSIKKVLDMAIDFAGNAKKYNIALIGSGTPGLKDAASIREQVLAKLPNRNTFIEGELGCCLGVHVGPGLVGVGVHILED